MKLRLSERAESDLDSIYKQGFEMFGEAAADRYISEVSSKLELLRTFPETSPLRLEVRPPVRLQLFKGHVIVYRAETGNLDVIRVLSRRQNWQDEA
jgi:toxin ParE1/3/4